MTNFTNFGHSLVVGVHGTIGAALFSRLQTVDAFVWGTTHKSYSEHSTRSFYLNLLDPPSSWQFPKIKFDVVYLCAGVCRMALCEEDPIATRQVNIAGMAAVIHHFANAGAFIVYLSTNQVFSGERPFERTAAAYQPMNEYGRQKAEIETFIKSNYENVAIVRLTKVVEKNMSLIKNWIGQLMQDRPVHAFQDMSLAPVSLRQVIDILMKIGQKKQPGCYQISGASDISYYDLAKYLVKCLQHKPSLIQSVSALDSGIKKIFLPRFTTLDCSSTIALCGEKPPHFSEVLNECFDITE